MTTGNVGLIAPTLGRAITEVRCFSMQDHPSTNTRQCLDEGIAQTLCCQGFVESMYNDARCRLPQDRCGSVNSPAASA